LLSQAAELGLSLILPLVEPLLQLRSGDVAALWRKEQSQDGADGATPDECANRLHRYGFSSTDQFVINLLV
jgi:hypothetical protein